MADGPILLLVKGGVGWKPSCPSGLSAKPATVSHPLALAREHLQQVWGYLLILCSDLLSLWFVILVRY